MAPCGKKRQKYAKHFSRIVQEWRKMETTYVTLITCKNKRHTDISMLNWRLKLDQTTVHPFHFNINFIPKKFASKFKCYIIRHYQSYCFWCVLHNYIVSQKHNYSFDSTCWACSLHICKFFFTHMCMCSFTNIYTYVQDTVWS